jgi:CubicO group peptidase (beta-lactamase class C family)
MPLLRSIRHAAALALLAPGATALRAQAPAIAPATLRALDALAAAEFARDSIASLTVGIVTARGLEWTRSHGLADIATRRRADRTTVYRIGSLTKMFTGLMLQQLVAAGTVQLDDSVARFYPEIREVPGYTKLPAPITLRQLATMTSGLAREPHQSGSFWTGPVEEWESILRDALPHTAIESAPGTRFSYSNVGYVVLGAALARAAGVPYVRWQEERILRPLGMQHTVFARDARIAADAATGYDVRQDGRVDGAQAAREALAGRGYKVPNGALFTTVEDLARFGRYLLTDGPPALLPHGSLDRVLQATVPAPPEPGAAYATGFSIMRRDGVTLVGHNGGVSGHVAAMYLDRAHGRGVIVLRNATGGRVRTDQLAFDLMRQLAGAPR